MSEKKRRAPRPQSYYDDIKRKFAEQRDLRLKLRPEGTQQFISELSGSLAKYATDPHGENTTATGALY